MLIFRPAHTYIAYMGEYPQVSSPGVGGFSREFLMGVCRPVLQILTRFLSIDRN